MIENQVSQGKNKKGKESRYKCKGATAAGGPTNTDLANQEEADWNQQRP